MNPSKIDLKRKRDDEIGEDRVLRLFGTTIVVSDSNTDRVFTCFTCNKGFPSFKALDDHRASHNSNHPNSVPIDLGLPEKLHTCRYCSAKFSTGQALGGHMTKHRSDTTKENKKDDGSSSKRKREDDVGEERFFLLFGAKIIITAEIKNSHENTRGHQANNSYSNPADLASGSVLVKSHACRFCSARFSTGQALGGHMTKHRSDTMEEKKKVDSSKEGSSSKGNLSCEEM